MTWWEKYSPLILGLGIPGALSAVARILWVRLVTIRDLEIAELKAEKKALMLELIAQYKLSSKLQGRYENDSTRPPMTKSG